MKDLNFKIWLEEADIFGFDQGIEPKTSDDDEGEPVHQFNFEELMDYLCDMKLPGKNPKIKLVNEIHWGDGGSGTMRVFIAPRMFVYLDRMGMDLEGNRTWLRKKSYQLNRAGYGGYERSVAESIFEEVKKIDRQPLERPTSDYKELDKLVLAMANKFRGKARDIFIFENITKKSDNHYIIKMGVRGHGIGAPNQQRVEANLTEIAYDAKAGKIRVINTNVESPLQGHVWALQPSDEDFYAFPSQSKDEIVEAMATFLKWY
jgi:hypothetical protein